jgi:hypothetical protein
MKKLSLINISGVPGTKENDVYATNYIVESIEDIQKSAHCQVK